MPEKRMSESYHRARRMFALLCGILIAWEYIGIDIGGEAIDNNQAGQMMQVSDSAAIVEQGLRSGDTVSKNISHITDKSGTSQDSQIQTTKILDHKVTSESGGTSKARKTKGVTVIIPGIGLPVTFLNAEVIPTIIVILVLYFSFRFTIEWRRSPKEIRDDRTSVSVAVVAYLIGFAAILLFVMQRMTQIRLADFFGIQAMLGIFLGWLVTLILLSSLVVVSSKKKRHSILLLFFVSVALSVVLLVVAFGLLISRPSLLGGSIFGCFTLTLGIIVVKLTGGVLSIRIKSH